ncbi:MAG: lasso peptide biosynthesis B2 protein [Pseudonocardiaceae bacterium]
MAAGALAVVLAVMQSGRPAARMARLTRLLERAARRTLGPATADRARQAVHAVRRVGLLTPGRVACLEESAAVVLMLAASRQGVTWCHGVTVSRCHGVTADPIRLHAWVETAGQPVAELKSTTRYTVLRIIDGTGQRRRSPSAWRTTARPRRSCGYAARK